MAEARFDPTYRRLAADYRLPDGSRRVYLHHIRKTAGTSVFLSFLALGGEEPMEVWRRINEAELPRTVSGDYAFVSVHRKLLAQGAYFFGRAHRPVQDQPLARGDLHVDRAAGPGGPGPLLLRLPGGGRPAGLPGSGDGARTADRLRRVRRLPRPGPERDLLSQLHTFSTSLDVSAAAERVASCSAVLFTERYAEGLADLSDRVGVPLAVHRARVTGDRSTLTPAQADRLRTMLEPEYQLLARLEDAGIGSRNAPA